MKDQTDTNESESKNLNIAVNYKYFTTSLIELLDIIRAKSYEIDLDKLDQNNKQDKKTFNGHTKLRLVCDELKNGFLHEEKYDEGRIIKKIYRVLTQYLDKFYPEPTKALFTIKNEEGATVTIIPGLDINLVTYMMDDKEMDMFWSHMYMMYISSVSMISTKNEHKKEGKVHEVLPKMRERVLKSGLFSKDGKMFNPFIGLMTTSDGNSSSEYNVETMFDTVEEIQKPTGPSMEDVFKLSGVDKLVDINQLNDQLKNVKQEDIQEATKNIAKLLGSENDADVTEVCNTLVEGIVADLKSNADGGIKGMFETAKRVSEEVGKNIDKNKMKKTVVKLSDFLKDGESNLKNMKDENGNPIGSKIMDSLKGPLEMAQAASKGNGGVPNMADMMALMSQVTGAVNTVKSDSHASSKPSKSSKKSKVKSSNVETSSKK